MDPKEKLTTVVYEDTFCLYDEKQYNEFIAPFYKRFEANGLDTALFKGKRCLDAGCGGGRASIFMAECGAKEVVGIDLSEKNIATATGWAKSKNFDNVRFELQSTYDLPFEDESFDIVWCNGVLHHTKDPDSGLKEITRVLKTGGSMWLYLYGSGGIYWYMAEWIRKYLKDVEVRDCIRFLKLMGVSARRIAEWIDDWFVPFLRCYTLSDVENRLKELGFDDPNQLKFGTVYDTSERKAKRGEAAFMGEGDLRFFCQKTSQPGGSQFVLPDPESGKGSDYEETKEVLQFEKYFEEIGQLLDEVSKAQPDYGKSSRILLSRSLHSKVRDLIEADKDFDAESLSAQMQESIEQLKETLKPS
jgi:ubiquinone/menaquinone biosynthesis C-methylase UbiE